MQDITDQYYTNNARQFVDSTLYLTSSMQSLYDKFIKRLKSNVVLDVGCGSGRDSLYFQCHSLIVTSIDKNKAMANAALENGVENVLNVDLEHFNSDLKYGGVWACASLLHINRSKLPDVFKKIADVVIDGGVLYCSFKYGTFEGYRNGRYFTDMTEKLLECVLDNRLKVEEMFISDDVRSSVHQKWLNVFLRKV